jgi:hypothetical protein
MTKQLLQVLRQAFHADPEAISSLVRIGVLCNERLAGHETIVCQTSGPEQDMFRIGIIGLMNGLAKNPDERIVVEMDRTTLKVKGFHLQGEFEASKRGKGARKVKHAKSFEEETEETI